MSFYESIGWGLHIVSVIILSFGTLYYFARRFRSHPEFGAYIIGLFLFELFSQKIGVILHNNLLLFSISSFFHFLFLTFIYTYRLFGITRFKLLLIIVLGSIPLCISSWSSDSTSTFQSYDRLFYDLIIILYTLVFYYKIILGSEWSKHAILLNGAGLLFFALDLFLAAATNFLVNQNLELVSWFWTGRAICLQFFYGLLIYYLWKDGKTPQRPSSG